MLYSFWMAVVVFTQLFFVIENQYQYCTFLSGTKKTNEIQIFGKTGEYSDDNSIGGSEKAESFHLSNEKEIIVFFPFAMGVASSNQIWKYSLEENQWKFIKGEKTANPKPFFNELNVFDANFEIGSRYSSSGWMYGEKENMLVTFFGGYARVLNETKQTNVNEIWSYNITSNSFLVNRCNSCGQFESSTEGFFSVPFQYNQSNIPSARQKHLIVKISEIEAIAIGGENANTPKISDYWIFSTELMQFKYMGGLNSKRNFVQPNIYHQNNTIEGLYSHIGTKINQEEILIFSFSSIFDIFKYNITSNQWKLIYKTNWTQNFGRNYNDINRPNRSWNNKIWKINENEIYMFGGTREYLVGEDDYQNSLTNAAWKFNIETDQWKFIGKEKTKSNTGGDLYPTFGNSDDLYSDLTIMGAMKYFIGHFIEEENELIICNGYGYAKNEQGKLNDCWRIYLGNMCNFLEDTNPNVCTSRGKCISHNSCECSDGYFGTFCELTKCNGYLSNSTGACSGSGLCVDSKCLCFEQSFYNNPDCSINEALKFFINTIWIYITVLILVIVIIFLFILFLLIFCKQRKNLKKFEEIEDVDIILQEQRISKDNSIAHFRINKKMFEIDIKDVQVLETIAQGGNAVVYRGLWNKQEIAYKCFIVQDYLKENKYKDFENEVELLSSISFPFILTFFGATLSSKRIGFVMEYAENGNVEQFLQSYKKKNNIKYPFYEKIRLLYEISSSMQFLHSKNVIHRDLKPKNVLITSKEETRLMDFGLSKLVENDFTKTKKVGTSFYIAPEVLNGKYSFECDIFSFSMLMFVVITEKYSPFGKVEEFNVVYKISKDPLFRPSIKELKTKIPKDINKKIRDSLLEMVENNWNHIESKRMKFQEISEFFYDILKNKKKLLIEIKDGHRDGMYWKQKYEKLKKKNEELEKRIKEIQKV